MNFSKDQMTQLGKVLLWNVFPLLIAGGVVHAYHLFRQADCRQLEKLEQMHGEELRAKAAFLVDMEGIKEGFRAYSNTLGGYLAAVKDEDELTASQLENSLLAWDVKLDSQLLSVKGNLAATTYRPVYEDFLESYRIRLSELKNHRLSKVKLIQLENNIGRDGQCQLLLLQKDEEIRMLNRQLHGYATKVGGGQTQALLLKDKVENLKAAKQRAEDRVKQSQENYEKLWVRYQNDLDTVFQVLKNGVKKEGIIDCVPCCQNKLDEIIKDIEKSIVGSPSDVFLTTGG